MFNAKCSAVAVLVLAFLFIACFSVPSQADDPGAAVKPFMTRLLNGQSLWNMLSKQSQDTMAKFAAVSAAESGSFKDVDIRQLEAFMRQELAKENSEISKAFWQGISKRFIGSGMTAADVTVVNVKVDGDRAAAVLKDGSTLKLFREGGVWKVGLLESGADE